MNTSTSPIRVGLIVPSSNVTIETELPRLLAQHASATFTFHSSRMRMQEVSEEELRAMNAQRERCVAELADIPCDSLVYGCLVALMAQGAGEQASLPTTVTSADALLEALSALGARRVALVT